ncbi:MAG: MFS transporter [Betaproteobacteria bacterium]
MRKTWFPQNALQPGVQPREVWGWALYDFANSGFTTVVITAVFNAYFVGVVAGGADWATLAWTMALGVSSALVVWTMPALGAHTDARRNKKRWLVMSTMGCVAATLVLALCGPGDLWLAMVAVVVANLCFSWGESLIASFLPELAKPEALGRVSGWGWSLGYLGGMLALGLSLGYVLWAQAQGQKATQFVPVTMVITAVVYALAACFTFAWLRERGAGPQVAPAATAAASGLNLRQVAVELFRAPEHRSFLWLMGCACAYQAGISVVIALAAVYAEQAMGFEQTQTMALIFLVNIAAALGAFAFGYFQDRVGHGRALSLTLWGWIGMTILAVAAQGPALFWVAAVLAGLCMGSSQSAGRAMAGLLAPASRVAEFFGLWTLATRVAAIVGPITYGLVTWVTSGNHRLAILGTGLFFVMGLMLLRRVELPPPVVADHPGPGR